MPAGYAHYIFGQKVLEKLDYEYRELINRNIDLYNIGVHGPDILFYYNVYKPNRVNKLGSYLHHNPAYNFIRNSKEVINNSKDKEASIAYMYGFITHFTLDHACHPYIREMQEKLSMTHSEIESELDRRLLVDRGLNPLTTSLTTHIHNNKYVSTIIAPFYDLDSKDINKTLHDLLFCLGWIKAPSHLKRNIVYAFLKLAGVYDEYKGLLINYNENIKSKECTNELINRIDNNVDIAVYLIKHYFDDEIDEIYNNDFE